MCIEQLIDISKALLTPVIAGVATYIAWQQWKTNKHKLVLEKYDRRIKIYEETKRILSIISRDADASYDDLLKFITSVSEADFLFGPEIPEYLDQIYKSGIELHRWNKEYKDYTQQKPPDYDHEKVVSNQRKEFEWLKAQFEPAKEKFRKYLDVSQ